jgi:hypothetical protein
MYRLSAAALAGAITAAAPAVAAPTFFAGTGHYYEYVSASVSQGSAFAAAQASGGYLATVTSQAEQDFLFSLGTGTAWIGASYSGSAWRWAVGPEAGQSFFGPASPDIAYNYWNGGEPNGNADEPGVVANWGGSGQWNDWSPSNSASYYVEYDSLAVPEPATWAMMLLGFGLVGAAVRRRANTAFA